MGIQNAFNPPGLSGLSASRRANDIASGREGQVGSAKGFDKVLAQIQMEPASESVRVQKGDTLVGIVRQQFKSLGLPTDARLAYREALQLARDNGIANADQIRAGQSVQIAGLQSRLTANNTLQALQERMATLAKPTTTAPAPSAAEATQATENTALAPASPAPNRTLLDQTLGRAVEKGYLAGSEVTKAQQKINALAQQFGFDPDHFAMLTLIESDGMNPQASNGRCHGIIQFCEGESKGAASVGMAGRAKQILGMGLVQQLDLVERYFNDIGMPNGGKKMGLDDLYLSVLSPAVRQETRRHVALPIAGRQAKELYVRGAPPMGITRDSIVHGLMVLAQKTFPQWKPQATTQVAAVDTRPAATGGN
ncbi:MAG: hypothetical protein RIT26_599 [Pseudomonadota bacterium]